VANNWPKGKIKSGGTVELENRRDLPIATPRKGFPFYTSTETQRSSQPTEVGTSGMATRGSIMLGAWGLGDVTVAAGKEMAGRCYDVVPSWHWKGWGPIVRRTDRDGEIVTRRI
jgi:hypothetical protein